MRVNDERPDICRSRELARESNYKFYYVLHIISLSARNVLRQISLFDIFILPLLFKIIPSFFKILTVFTHIQKRSYLSVARKFLY